MKRITAVLALVGMLSIAACSSDSTTAPVLQKPDTASTPQFALMSVSVAGPVNNSIFIGFGKEQPFDTSSFFLGLEDASSDYAASHPLALVGGSSAIIMMRTGDVLRYLESDGKIAPTYQFVTDWQAVDPQNHKGVKYDGTSTVIFEIMRWTRSTPGGPYDTFLGYSYQSVTMTKPGLTPPLVLPAAKDILYVVHPIQFYRIGCSGNDALIFRSQNGVGGLFTDDAEREPTLDGLRTVAEVTIHCGVY